jgi:hypothetical protein
MISGMACLIFFLLFFCELAGLILCGLGLFCLARSKTFILDLLDTRLHFTTVESIHEASPQK